MIWTELTPCLTVRCDRCPTVLGDDDENPGSAAHFASNEEATSVLAAWGWAALPDGRHHCQRCVKEVECERAGHDWGQWHLCGCHGTLPAHLRFVTAAAIAAGQCAAQVRWCDRCSAADRNPEDTGPDGDVTAPRRVDTRLADTTDVFPFVATVHRPGLPDVHLGFVFAHQAEQAARSLTDDLRNTAHVAGTTITHAAAPDGVPMLAPLPTDPYELADLIAHEDSNQPPGHAFPDLYSRLKAQQGYERASRIWTTACSWMAWNENENHTGDVTGEEVDRG